jgi:nitroimidazol reductase NimA-like FMN-containing flavoprotein (pyridoxamine 5'-phosphate oxidase superfamily)
MGRMTRDEKQEFLAALHVGVLALNQAGAGPLTAPVWYDYSPGKQLWFITDSDSRKGALLEVGTRLGLTAQIETPPYSYVSVEGPVSSIAAATTDELIHMATRYLGREQGEAYTQAVGVEKSLTIRVDPERWLAFSYAD